MREQHNQASREMGCYVDQRRIISIILSAITSKAILHNLFHKGHEVSNLWYHMEHLSILLLLSIPSKHNPHQYHYDYLVLPMIVHTG